jgi:hypothetical protein
MYKNMYFWLWSEQKGDFKSAEGNGRPSKQDAWSEEKISITGQRSICDGLNIL